MPEGPEILTFSTYLNKKLKNYKLDNILSFTDKPVIIPKDFNNFIVLNSKSKGKQMWLELSNGKQTYFLHIHLGITGWLEFQKPDKYVKFIFIFSKDNKEIKIYMEDKRRFSKVKLLTKEQHELVINKLGTDFLSSCFSINKFTDAIKKQKTILAGFLLKQNIFSGIGNYIKNEALHLTNLKIKVKTNDLSDKQIVELYNNIMFVAYSSLFEQLESRRISKYLAHDYTINKPKKLEVPYEFKVYSQEITDSGEKVYKIKVAGRDSYCVKKYCS
jgi:formamidopyrimidine-DNA glycosylase